MATQEIAKIVAADASDKPMEDMDVDHELLGFKSKQNQSNSEAQKSSSSQKLDQQFVRPVPDACAQIGKSFGVRKSMMVSSSKSAPAKSPPGGLKSSNSSAKASPLRSLDANLKPSAAYRSENVIQLMKVGKPLTEPTAEPNDSKDSESDKLHGAWHSTSLLKNNSNNECKGSNAPRLGQRPSIPNQEDSDDETVEARAKLKLLVDMEDDDELLVLKWSSSSWKQNQSNSEAQKSSSSQKLDRQLVRPMPDVCAQNGKSSGVQKGKMISSSKSPPVKSRPCMQASNSSAKASSLSSPEANMKHSEAYRSENVNQPMMVDKPSTGPAAEPNSSKGSNASSLGQKSSIPKSDEEKLFAAKNNQNWSALRDRGSKKPSTMSSKRPASKVESARQSSIKKHKLSNASMPINNNQASGKAETEVEDDKDHVHISQRMKKLAASDKRSSEVKKVTKVVSSSLNTTNKKSKKVIEKSQDSKSSEVPPISGEWQRWTTLVQSGVIFPPPYQPHGVMVLYKGKPVALTPEQEKVATMFAVMLDTDYINKPNFKENFMNDWKKILGKNHIIQNFDDCDFTQIYEWHQKEKEKKNQMTTEDIGTENGTTSKKEDNKSDEIDDFSASVCEICDDGGSLLCCQGKCMRSFHPTVKDGAEYQCKTLGYTDKEVEEMNTIDFYCENCKYNQHQCFVCGELGSSDESSLAEVFCCVNGACGRFYHPLCVGELLHPREKSEAEKQKRKIAAGEPFACPLHKCYVCEELEVNSDPNLQFAICRRCPKAYHRKCLPMEIAFGKDADKGITQRAWNYLLPNRVLIYCLNHKIDETISTPIRNHIKFPGVKGNKKTQPLGSSGKKKVVLEELNHTRLSSVVSGPPLADSSGMYPPSVSRPGFRANIFDFAAGPYRPPQNNSTGWLNE